MSKKLLKIDLKFPETKENKKFVTFFRSIPFGKKVDFFKVMCKFFADYADLTYYHEELGVDFERIKKMKCTSIIPAQPRNGIVKENEEEELYELEEEEVITEIDEEAVPERKEEPEKKQIEVQKVQKEISVYEEEEPDEEDYFGEKDKISDEESPEEDEEDLEELWDMLEAQENLR